MITVLVAALVAHLKHNRIYPLALPAKVTYPAIRYQQVAGNTDTTHSATTGPVVGLWQFSCYGETYAEAKALAASVSALLDLYTNPTSTPVIEVAFPAGERDLYEPEDKLHQVALDFRIWHQ